MQIAQRVESRVVSFLGFEPGDRRADCQSAAGDDFESPAHGLDFVVRDARPAHADDVDSVDDVDVLGDEKRGEILAEARGAREHRQPADAAELVHRGVPGEERPIADFRVPAEEGVIGENAAVPHPAVGVAFHFG